MPNMYSDPAFTWDDIITNRCIYYEYIEDKYYNREIADDFEMSSYFHDTREEIDLTKQKTLDKINKSKLLMRIKFAQAAQMQGNYKLALAKLQLTKGIFKDKSSNLAEMKITWAHCYLNTHLSRAKMANNPDKSLSMFLDAIVLKEITKYDKDDGFSKRPDLFQEHCVLHANFSKFLIDSFVNICNSESSDTFFETLNSDDKKKNQLLDYIQTKDISNVEMVIYNIFLNKI